MLCLSDITVEAIVAYLKKIRPSIQANLLNLKTTLSHKLYTSGWALWKFFGMRLKICTCCVIDDKLQIEFIQKPKGAAIELQTGPPLTQQPRRGESIQLDDLSTKEKTVKPAGKNETKKVKKSMATINESEFTTPSKAPSSNGGGENSKQVANLIRLPNAKQLETICPTVKATSNFSYISKNGDQYKMAFQQIAPGHFKGMFKGREFFIVNGQLEAKVGDFNKLDKESILKNYSQTVLAMQQGVLGLEGKVKNLLNQQFPALNVRHISELTIPNGSKVNVNFTAENGKKYKMAFKQITPGLFRGTCNRKVFSIANGQVLVLRKADANIDKELILSSFYRAMVGMQQTKLGLHREEWAVETRLSGDQLNPMELLKAASPKRRVLFEAESLKAHNEYRKIHGVHPLVHSEMLCEKAREWAEHLALKDTTFKRNDQYYGENLYYAEGVPFNARKTIETWYNEIQLYDFENPRYSHRTEHFTQLVWKSTKEVGTGIAQLGDKIWVCCYYHPAGNGLSLPFEEFVLRPVEID